MKHSSLIELNTSLNNIICFYRCYVPSDTIIWLFTNGYSTNIFCSFYKQIKAIFWSHHQNMFEYLIFTNIFKSRNRSGFTMKLMNLCFRACHLHGFLPKPCERPYVFTQLFYILFLKEAPLKTVETLGLIKLRFVLPIQ